MEKIETQQEAPVEILCLFDYAATTGFATVSQNILAWLSSHYKKRVHFTIIAINYFGLPYQDEQANILVFPASGTELGIKEPDWYGRHGFLKLLQEDHFDGIFIIQDPGLVLPMVPNLRDIKAKKKEAGEKVFKSMYYFPVDGPIVKETMLENFEFFDTIVAYTEYARTELLRAVPKLVDKKIRVILHGINPQHFFVEHDFNKVEKFRKEYFGDNAHKFIITNVNRNQPRKDIPGTIFAFEEFIKTYERDAFLYLHMTPDDKMGWDLRRVLRQTSLKEGVHYMFPPKNEHNAQTKVETLNLIYNACDAFVTTTTGEGFGLTVLEAMRCGLPVIGPSHTSLVEVGGNGSRIFAIEEFYPYCTHFDNDIRYQCDYVDVAEKMNEVFKGKKNSAKIINASLYAANMTWERICVRWIEEFDKLFF